MKKKIISIISVFLLLTVALTGCGQSGNKATTPNDNGTTDNQGTTQIPIQLDAEMKELDDGLSAVRYEGDYGFDLFLEQGGASSDAEVVRFLTNHLLNESGLGFIGELFGCSTLAVQNEQGEYLFGRNFDWENCNALIVSSKPENGYASISTVNTDFVVSGAPSLSKLSQEVLTVASLYAPLDGMNEKGLVVSVNMIQDSDTIEQNTVKPDITTTTAVRLLLDKAANVDEALELLSQYDMHASMGYMVHLALADTAGRHVVVEYIDNEMVVTDTPVVTNFYLADGEKNGIGTAQSHERYEILQNTLSEYETLSMEGVREALNSVSKDNFNEFESTEWSIVFNQSTGEVQYYHRENYETPYNFKIN
jgi:predicted choloylglycine hydrolase/predicted small lipoprotein YifL